MHIQIDVIIPTFNRLNLLKRVLPFYLQRPEVQRVIVVDDHSTDGTMEWLEEQVSCNTQLHVERHKTRRGASAARNTGADVANQSLVFFADDDMLIDPPNGLSILADEMSAKQGDIISPVFIYSESELRQDGDFSKITNSDYTKLYYPLRMEFKPRKKLIKAISSNTFKTELALGLMLMKREVLIKIRYDEELGLTSYRDETDFQLKALGQGFSLLACPQVTLLNLEKSDDKGGCHSYGMLRFAWEACRNNWRFLKRHHKIIRNRLKILVPMEILQLVFILNHFFVILPYNFFYREFRRFIK